MKVFDLTGTLRARAHQGLRASLKGAACLIALVIGTAMPADARANNQQYKEFKKLANYQLTDKQYACHNEIIYRESRWNYKAIGNKSGTKQVYGLYQMKTDSLEGSTPIKQFWMYWYYVAHRYGVTQYDEPNYCGALHHLNTKGWQ
jgi:hypothetical protein